MQKIQYVNYNDDKTFFYLSDMRFMMYSMSESPNFGAVSNKIPFSSEASG